MQQARSRPGWFPFVRTVLWAVLLLPVLRESVHGQQRISGVVRSDSGAKPIAEVALTLLDADGRIMGKPVRSDSAGNFSISVPREGRFKIDASRIGFVRVVTPTIAVDKGFEVPVEITMSVVAQILAPLTITGRPIPISRDLDEFEFRRKQAHGTFFTREDIERRSPADMLALFRDVAGMRVTPDAEGNFNVYFLRAPTRGDALCLPAVYLDGMKMSARSGGGNPLQSLSSTIQPDKIYGIELYSGASRIPGLFAGSDAACGVVAIWTRRGGDQ